VSRAYWTRLAQADLAAIDDYYERLNPDFALRVARKAIAASRFLADHPRAGPEIDPGIRKWRVPTTDYILVYRVVGGGIEVVRVYHAQQQWRPE
jgi:toxin ParE1/3/4